MNPAHDIVVSLLETPFSRRSEQEKREIVNLGRPKPLISTLSTDKKHGRTFSRSFQSSWYEVHKWLCGSSYQQSLFCWPCLLLSGIKNVWSSNGYVDLKNFSRSAKSHDSSREHIKNSMGLRRLEQNVQTIAEALQENARTNKILFNENVRKNRILMTYLIDVAITLAKQELAFRGHDESNSSINQGNFREIFQCLIKRNVELSEHAAKFSGIFTGQSKTIQNELIHCIENYLIEFIKKEINSEDCYFLAVQADDTTDIVEKSQCAISVRYVNSQAEIKERFLGFFNVSADKTAEALFQLISNVLEPYNFEKRLVAQCYDGASVMAGELNGLQAKMKSKAPLALFTHCCAHRLNLVLQQGTNSIPQSRIFFATLMGIPGYFHHSPKRSVILDDLVGKRVPRAIDVRWFTRSKILYLIANEWNKFILVFETIINNPESGSESIRLAKGFLKHFSEFEFAFLTLLYKDIFAVIDILYQILQTKSLDIQYCIGQINTSVLRIQQLRDEKKVNDWFTTAKNLTGLPTRRGTELSEEEILKKYKILSYEILDCIVNQIETRFENLSKLEFLSLFDPEKFSAYVKHFPSEALNCLCKTYPKIFNAERLTNELSHLYDDEQFRACSDIQSIMKLINNELKIKDIFSETYKLLCLILTIPATTVSVERNFSCLKRIKTYLRNTMSQERLSALGLLSIEKELLVNVSKDPQFYEDIIDKFANLKDRRIDLIYKK